jgi:hypothetical protein
MRVACVLIGAAVALLLVTRERSLPPGAERAPMRTELKITPKKNASASASVPFDTASDPERLVIEAAGWAKNDPEAAAAWAREKSDPELRERLVVAVATTWADEDPNRAAKFLLESVAPGQAQENAAIGILQRMALKDMAAAEEWAGRFPEGARERAAAELARIRERQFAVVKE